MPEILMLLTKSVYNHTWFSMAISLISAAGRMLLDSNSSPLQWEFTFSAKWRVLQVVHCCTLWKCTMEQFQYTFSLRPGSKASTFITIQWPWCSSHAEIADRHYVYLSSCVTWMLWAPTWSWWKAGEGAGGWMPTTRDSVGKEESSCLSWRWLQM